MNGIIAASFIETQSLSVTSFSMDRHGDTTGPNACSSGVLNWTRYHDGDYILPEGGDTLYTGDPGTPSNKFNGGNKWYKISALVVYQIDSNGLLGSFSGCIS